MRQVAWSIGGEAGLLGGGYASIRRGYESIDQMVTSWPRNPGNQATDFSSGRIEIGLQTAPFGKIDTYQPLSAKLVSQTTLVEEGSPKNSATVRRTLLLLRLPPSFFFWKC